MTKDNGTGEPKVRSALTGQMVATSSVEWQHESDVEYLLWLPLLERNRVLRSQPPEIAERLRADMKRLQEIRKRR